MEDGPKVSESICKSVSNTLKQVQYLNYKTRASTFTTTRLYIIHKSLNGDNVDVAVQEYNTKSVVS